MCLTIDISAFAREKIGLVVCCLSILMCVFGVILISLSIYLKLHIEEQMMLLEGYDTGVLPYFLLSVGIASVIVNIIVGKIGYDSGYVESQGPYKNVLFFTVALCFVFFWFVFAGGIMCFSHRGVIEETLRTGFSNLMSTYKTKLNIKIALDEMQQEYHCCGGKGYSEWFAVNWIPEENLNLEEPQIKSKLKGGLYFSDDVPFSCCDVTTIRPCIHQHVTNKSAYPHYGDVTVYKTGCPAVMMKFIEDQVLLPTGWTTLSASFVQLMALVFLRYLQTSLAEAFLVDDPERATRGYLFPDCPCCQTGDAMKYVRNKDKSSGSRSRDTISDEDDYEIPEQGGGNLDFGGGDSSPTKKDKGKDKRKDKKDKTKKKGGKKGDKEKKKDKKDCKKSSKEKKNKNQSSPKSKNKASPKGKKSPPLKKKKISPNKKTSPPIKKKKISPKPKMSPKRMSPRRGNNGL